MKINFDKENCELKLYNELQNEFKIHISGSDLYWTMINYCDNNEFVITSDDEMYDTFIQLFNDIKENDNKYENVLNDNTFEWKCEAGYQENSNMLLIKKEDNKFIIKFIQNPNNMYSKITKTCSVCFCLSGSRNQEVAYLFSSMYNSYIERFKEKNKKKVLE